MLLRQAMVTAFLWLLPVFAAEDGDVLDAAPTRDRPKTGITEPRVIERSVALERVERVLARTQKLLGDLYLEVESLREKLDYLQLRAALLMIHGADFEQAGEVERIRRDLAAIQELYQELHGDLLDYKRSVDSVIDILAPEKSEQFKDILEVKLDLILRKVMKVEALAKAVPQEVEKREVRRRALVLGVNKELSVVVLDIGREHGARPSMLWEIDTGKGGTVMVQLIRVRLYMSAATVVKGRFKDIELGAKAVAVIKNKM